MATAFLDAIRLVRETATQHGFRIALIGGFALPFHGVRRAPTIAMLERATMVDGPAGVPVVDVEGLIGLKLQAIVNDPRRRRQDEADIVQLMRLHLPALNHALLEQYFALFDQKDALTRFLDEARHQRD